MQPMGDKKLLLTVFLVITAAAGGAVFVSRSIVIPQQAVQVPSRETLRERPIPRVTVMIDDGERVATYSGIEASDAFAALSKTAQANGIALETKTYDFGIFVESIGGKRNTSERAWIYYVNGISGNVAADKKQVTAGDRVEWRYVRPQ